MERYEGVRRAAVRVKALAHSHMPPTGTNGRPLLYNLWEF